MKTLDRILISIEKALLSVSLAAFAFVVAMTTVDTLGRYLLNSPITFAYELTEKYLMPLGVFLAFAYAYRNDVFIRVNFFLDKMPRGVQMILDHAAQIATACYCLFFGYSTLQQAIKGLADGSTLSNLPLLLSPSYFIIPIGFLAMAVLVVLDLHKVKDGKSHLMPKGGDEASQSLT